MCEIKQDKTLGSGREDDDRRPCRRPVVRVGLVGEPKKTAPLPDGTPSRQEGRPTGVLKIVSVGSCQLKIILCS